LTRLQVESRYSIRLYACRSEDSDVVAIQPVQHHAAPFSFSSGSVATFSANNLSAPIHTLALLLSLSFIKLGNSAALNASLASLGIKLGKWSIEMTLSKRPAVVCTGTVGWSKVVLMS